MMTEGAIGLSYDKCPICGIYRFSDERHRCPPQWHCIVMVDGEDPEGSRYPGTEYDLYAYSPDVAAEKAAMQFDLRYEHAIAEGDCSASVVVCCLHAGFTTQQTFQIRGSYTPLYTATEVKPR